LAAALLSLLVTALLLEIMLRIFGPPYYRFNNLSQEYYSNPRGYHDVLRREDGHTIFGLTYHDDVSGYRTSDDQDMVADASAGVHILGLGDSFTYGRGVRYEDVYLTRLQNALNGESADVAVKNCGLVGAGVAEIIEVYERESAELPPGSLVIYGLVLNDFGVDSAGAIKGLNFIDINNGGYTYNPLRERSSLVNFVLHAIDTRRLHTATLRAYEESFEGESAARGFEQMQMLHQSVVEDGGSLLVVVFPLLYDFDDYPFSAVHEMIAKFCAREGIACLDLFPAFSRHKAEDLWANPTDHHPNEVAHRIAADEIARFIEGGEVPLWYGTAE
jgi:lysophospholipase L1-like esterase